MKYLILLFTMISTTFLGLSQNARLKYADRMYEQKAYYYASEAYEDVIARKVDSATVAVKIADCYDKIGNRKKAAVWYNFLNRQNLLTKEQHYRLVLIEHGLEEYNKSSELLASFESKYGANESTKALNKSLNELKKDNDQFEIKSQKVNTTSSDMSASFYNDKNILLASSKRRSKAVMSLHSWTGNYFYDLYSAPINENGEIGKMKLLKAGGKTKYHDGPAVYNAKNGYVYFTRNNFLNGKKGYDDQKSVRLKIYKAKYDGKKLVDVTELSINDNAFSSAHPAISEDGKKLFFASDRPGGFGGMDIYSVGLDNDGNTVGSPINLGQKVNTNQHELFPSFNSTENLLFFSSEGHFGLGGLDVFMAKMTKTGDVTSIENLGSPINSTFDDFSFTANPQQTKGFFTSNRNGGKGDDDIYGFNQKFPFRNSAVLKGNAINLLTKEKVENATVYIADKNGVIVDSTTSKDDGTFEFSLATINDDFSIVGQKENFVEGKQSVKYDATKMEYQQDVELMPLIDYYFTGVVKDKATKELLSGVQTSISDNLKNELFENVKTNDNGAFKSTILPYKYQDKISYEFKLEKDGYITKTVALADILALQQEINVNGVLSLELTKIEVGKTDLNDVIAINPIYFDLNKSDIRPDAAVELNKIVEVMKQNPGMVIELGSHTDSRGSDASNLSLSDRRAKSSAKYIISQGIAKDRIYGKGYGESKLKVSDAEIAKAKTEEEKETLHQQNRRTEFIIVKMK